MAVHEESGGNIILPSIRSGEGSGVGAFRRIDYLVLHCSDTRPDQDFTVETLQKCHKARGFGKYPGYHIYVRRDGTCYYTRPISLKGCHVKGHNSFSIGVCYEGGRRPTPDSLDKSRLLAEGLSSPLSAARTSLLEGSGNLPMSQCERPRTAVHEELLKRGGGYTPVPYGRSGRYEDNRTEAQKVALHEVFATLHELFPDAKIVGHNEFGVAKACPCLSKAAMDAFRAEIVGN